jgi:hypothetical protein
MDTRDLTEKIKALPPEQQAEVEDFVEFLRRRFDHGRAGAKTFPVELLRAINDDREELRRTKGVFDPLPLIRDFLETGGR